MMKTLLETLGPEAARRFLTFALPQLEIRSQELLDNLRAGNYEAAANCAHKLKGTVHLYTPRSYRKCCIKLPPMIRKQALMLAL